MTLLGLSLPGSHPRLCHSLAASDKLVHRGEGHCQTERNQGPCLETKRNSGKAQILTPIKRGRGVGPSQERGGAIQVSSTTMAGFFFCNARHYHVPMLFILCWCLEIRCYKTKLYLLLCWEENSESYGNPPKPWFHWILGSLLILWFWIWSKFFCVCWIIHSEERIHVTLQSTCILIFVNKLRSWCTQRIHVDLFVCYMVIHVCVNNQTYISREIFIFNVKS